MPIEIAGKMTCGASIAACQHVPARVRAGECVSITALSAAIAIIRRDITRHPLRFVTA